jgi:GTP cyclohydrolase I
MSEEIVLHLPDTQNAPDTRGVKINKVGISGVSLPITLYVSKEHTEVNEQHTIAKVSGYVDLPAHVKGVNMSRFAQVFDQHLTQYTLKPSAFIDAVKELQKRNESETAFLKVRTTVYIEKQSPVSKLYSKSPYEVIFEAHSSGKLYVTPIVQYISTCPCSQALGCALEEAGTGRGAPHMQRSFANVTVEFDSPENVDLQQLILDIEKSVVTIPYTLIKRPDEQAIAKLTWEHPQFSEDAARNITMMLDSKPEIIDYVVVVDHEESIHYHNAVAIVNAGKYLR